MLIYAIRMEKVDISRRGAQAMVVGTVVACGGATLMTLYKGIVVISPHAQGSHQTVLSSKVMLDKTWLKGSFMLIISNLSLSVFYVLQVIQIININIIKLSFDINLIRY